MDSLLPSVWFAGNAILGCIEPVRVARCCSGMVWNSSNSMSGQARRYALTSSSECLASVLACSPCVIDCVWIRWFVAWRSPNTVAGSRSTAVRRTALPAMRARAQLAAPRTSDSLPPRSPAWGDQHQPGRAPAAARGPAPAPGGLRGPAVLARLGVSPPTCSARPHPGGRCRLSPPTCPSSPTA
jgi:hypothetical protein